MKHEYVAIAVSAEVVLTGNGRDGGENGVGRGKAGREEGGRKVPEGIVGGQGRGTEG